MNCFSNVFLHVKTSCFSLILSLESNGFGINLFLVKYWSKRNIYFCCISSRFSKISRSLKWSSKWAFISFPINSKQAVSFTFNHFHSFFVSSDNIKFASLTSKYQNKVIMITIICRATSVNGNSNKIFSLQR